MRPLPTANSSSLAIIVPVHDEAESLAATLETLQAEGPPHGEIVVVDDGSSDGSAEIAKRAGVRVVRHDRLKGYGASLKTGLSVTRSRYVAIVDADGSYSASDLVRLRQDLPTGGMVVGARREPSPVRRFLKALLCLQVRLFTGAAVPDLNSGLRVFDRALAARLSPVLPNRFSFTTTLTLGALALSVPVRFVPVDYHRRSAGRSKFTCVDAWRMARTVARGCAWMSSSSVKPRTPSPTGTHLRWAICAVVLAALSWAAPRSASSKLLYSCALGAALYVPFFLFKVARWRHLLASTGVRLRWFDAIRAYLAGLAIGAVTPGRAGEFARIAAPRRLGHPLGPLVLATVADRAMDLGVVAGVALGAAYYWTMSPSWIVLAAGTTMSAVLLVATLPPLIRFALTRVLKVKTSVPRLSRVSLSVALGWTALSMSLFFVMALILAHSSGVWAPPEVLLGAIAAGNLAAIVPVSVGGIGSRESAVLVSLGSAGFAVGTGMIASYALCFHLVFTLTPWVLLLGCELARAPKHFAAPAESALSRRLTA